MAVLVALLSGESGQFMEVGVLPDGRHTTEMFQRATEEEVEQVEEL